jgi:hypothetical protein
MTFTYSAVPTSTSTPIQSVVIAFGDGVVLPGSTAGGTVTHSYSAQGSYEPVVAAVDSSGQSGQDSTSVVVVPSNTAQPPVNVIAPVQPVYVVTGFEPNVDLVASTTTAQVGQTVTFSYAAIPYSAPIQTVLITFGDGVALPAPAPTGAVTHAYSAQGTYQALVTATDTTGQYGQDVATTSVVPATTTQPQASVPLVSMTYLAGWNLVAAPTGTVITGATPPLYTWQTGDTAYVPSQTTTSGYGHWAYFAAPSAVGMPVTAPSTITKSLQPNVYVMIGNSGTTSATVTGADVVYVYNPSTGYQATNVLLPGQGAWVLSSTGGNMTIASNPV